MIRLAAIAFLAVHGLVHWIGFAIPWRLMASQDNPYSTAVLWGSVDLGETGIRLLGVAWLVPIALFIVAALAIWRRVRSALFLTTLAAAVSLVLCVLGMPGAVIGTAIDVGILALVAARLVVGPGRMATLAR
ncbi:MAG TPA: hypothetical protein VIV06_10675 [Candidatus Limnocylindrales bacterium]